MIGTKRGNGMSAYREWAHEPDVRINGREYIPKDIFIQCFVDRIQQERRDCTEEEQIGLDIALTILQNLK